MSNIEIFRVGQWIAGAVAAAVLVAGVGLAGLLAFGTASQPPELKSVSAPMRQIDFSDLPRLQRFTARDGQALSYRLYPGTGPDGAGAHPRLVRRKHQHARGGEGPERHRRYGFRAGLAARSRS